VSVVKEYACGIHDLVYMRVRPGCPVCAIERQLEGVTKERDEAMGDLAELRGRLKRVQGTADLAISVEEATDLLDDRDRAFLKTVLYRWRDAKDIDLGVTPDVRGFTTNDETHECSSVGGLAIAGFFSEAIMAYGRPVAMSLLQRGMGQHLKGGT
jgi:hypothetical protein